LAVVGAEADSHAGGAQAIALFRTVGDVGLLVGAATAGVLADKTSLTVAMQGDAALLLGASAVFGVASWARQRPMPKP